MTQIPMDLSIFTDLFQSTSIIGIPALIGAILTLITCALITRKTANWQTLAFPISIGWMVVGIDISIIQLLATGLLFAVDGLGMQAIGGILEAGVSTASEGIKKGINRIPAIRRRDALGEKGAGKKITLGQLGIEQTMPKSGFKDVRGILPRNTMRKEDYLFDTDSARWKEQDEQQIQSVDAMIAELERKNKR